MLDIFSNITDMPAEIFGAVVEQLWRALSPLAGAMRGGTYVELEFINEHLIGLNAELESFGKEWALSTIGMARALATIFALMVAAGQAYKMMAEQKGIDVLELGRPLLIALVLSFWGSFTTMVTYPGKVLEGGFRSLYMSTVDRVESNRKLRSVSANEVSNRIRASRQAAKQQEESPDFFEEMIDVALEKVQEVLIDISVSWTTDILNWLQEGIIWLGEIAFQCGVYIIFLMKAIFMTVLVMFGPVQFAASILPIWKDSWSTWIGKAVSVSMYGSMAYLVMAFSMTLINYGLESDLIKLEKVVEDPGMGTVWAYFSGMLGTTVTTAITYFVGCFAFATVPEISTWIIPSTTTMAAGGFISGMSGKAKGAVNSISPIKV